MTSRSHITATPMHDLHNIWSAACAVLLGVVLHLVSGPAFAELLDGHWKVTGQAFDRKSGELLYTEHHDMTIRNNFPVAHSVVYRLPDGSELATKSLDYSKATFSPDFRLEDLRDGYIEGGQTTEQGYRLLHRKDGNAETENRTVPQPAELDLIADAGFDAYVKATLEELMDGKSKRFKLAVAGQLDSYSFEARVIEKFELFGRPAVRIRIQPASILRLLVAPIDIIYDLETTALLRYEGLSNIRNKDGKRYDTRIDFPPEIQRRISTEE